MKTGYPERVVFSIFEMLVSVCLQMQTGEMFLRLLVWTAVSTEPKLSLHRDPNASGHPEINSESQREAHRHLANHRYDEPQTFKYLTEFHCRSHHYKDYKLAFPEGSLPLKMLMNQSCCFGKTVWSGLSCFFFVFF